MLMLFGKKKEKELPLDEIRKMAGQGISDRDIIKELKSRGFSYDEIEKAMLQAVKEGVGESPQTFAPPGPVRSEPVQSEPAPAPEFELPSFEEEPASDESSEVVLEELVEGVIEEKWQKFEDRISGVEENFEHIKSEIKQFESRLAQEKSQSPTKELDLRISDLSQHLDDMDARIGGLEKAFKQFLPALTRNIESLSQIIHEIKDKHQVVEEEV